MKLFTTSTALSRLGPDSRIATTVRGDGADRPQRRAARQPLSGRRRRPRPGHARPSTAASSAASAPTSSCSSARSAKPASAPITGRLYADDSVFDRLRGVADSGYATSSYIGPLSGLSLQLRLQRRPSASGFAADPAKTAAATLARALRGAGVRVPTKVALGTAPAGSTELARVESPPLTEIVNTTDVYSDNFFAEMLIKLLGARFGGAGTTAAGATVVERFARGHGSGVHAVDGSGLTRSNRASPSAGGRPAQDDAATRRSATSSSRTWP